MPTSIEIAKTIAWPRHRAIMCDTDKRFEEQQAIAWSRLTNNEQQVLVRTADILRDMFENDREVIGYAVADAQGTRYRCAGYDTEQACGYSWTEYADKALMFARREDAEAFARDDEDAWRIVRITQRTSADAVSSADAPTIAPERASNDAAGEALRLFAAFVDQNARVWELGAHDHHHPIWALIAPYRGDDVRSGPEWAFIRATNRAALAELTPQPSRVARCERHQKPDQRWGCLRCDLSWDSDPGVCLGDR